MELISWPERCEVHRRGQGFDSPGEDDDDEGGNGGAGGDVVAVMPMATVEEVVIAINLRFKEKVSPKGIQVVESYLKSLHKAEELKTTIKSNMANDERQVYELVIKQIMDKLYSDYIINNSPEHYGELTQDNIQSFINHSAYRMLREILRTAA